MIWFDYVPKGAQMRDERPLPLKKILKINLFILNLGSAYPTQPKRAAISRVNDLDDENIFFHFTKKSLEELETLTSLWC